MDYKSLGENIRTYRKNAKLTQAQLAEIIGYSDSYIGQIENARTKPSLEAVVRIAKALFVTVDQLLVNDVVVLERGCFAEIEEKIKNFSAPTQKRVYYMLSAIVDDILNNLDTFYNYDKENSKRYYSKEIF